MFYSVYCSKTDDFACGNATVVRSVKKTSVTDVGVPAGTAYYKVVAFDSRFNAGAPAEASVDVR